MFRVQHATVYDVDGGGNPKPYPDALLDLVVKGSGFTPKGWGQTPDLQGPISCPCSDPRPVRVLQVNV